MTSEERMRDFVKDYLAPLVRGWSVLPIKDLRKVVWVCSGERHQLNHWPRGECIVHLMVWFPDWSGIMNIQTYEEELETARAAFQELTDSDDIEEPVDEEAYGLAERRFHNAQRALDNISEVRRRDA